MGIKLGVAFSASDLGASPGVLRDFALLAEELGYDDLMLPDPVLGAKVASRPNWGHATPRPMRSMIRSWRLGSSGRCAGASISRPRC